MLPEILPQQSRHESISTIRSTTNTDESNLRLESTLQELLSWQVHIEIEFPGMI